MSVEIKTLMNNSRSAKVKAEDLKNIRLLPFGKKHPVKQWIEDLEVGEAHLVFRRDFDWKGGKTPNMFVPAIEKKTGRKFRVMKMEGTMGWAIERLS